MWDGGCRCRRVGRGRGRGTTSTRGSQPAAATNEVTRDAQAEERGGVCAPPTARDRRSNADTEAAVPLADQCSWIGRHTKGVRRRRHHVSESVGSCFNSTIFLLPMTLIRISLLLEAFEGLDLFVKAGTQKRSERAYTECYFITGRCKARIPDNKQGSHGKLKTKFQDFSRIFHDKKTLNFQDFERHIRNNFQMQTDLSGLLHHLQPADFNHFITLCC